MAHGSGVSKALVALLSAGVAVSCGASRSNKFSKSCSSLKAVAEGGGAQPKTLRAGETYDPSAVLLHFRAQSDKISIESRCNARLMHKLSVLNITAPVNLETVDFQLSGASQRDLELHTSSHCFFRVWDTRSASQVESNPELNGKDVQKILSDDFERYKLYKSLLTSSQKMFAFTESGEPIEFEYTLKNATRIFSDFFRKIDQYDNKNTAKSFVGREFSKTSFLLDELALDVCSADSKLAKRSQTAFDALIAAGGLGSIRTDVFKGNTGFKDLVRRKALHNGRHKLCFSQSDLIVAPIVLGQALSGQQVAHLQRIHDQQKSKVAEFKIQLTNSLAINPPVGTEQNKRRFLSGFYAGTKAAPSLKPNGCTWVDQFPAISATHPIMDNLSNNLKSWKEVGPSDFNTLIQGALSQLPASFQSLIVYAGDNSLRDEMNLFPKWEACHMVHGSFNESTKVCSLRSIDSHPLTDPEHGMCPPSAEKFEVEAARIQVSVNASLRLALISALQALEKYRAASDEILLLPLASLHGVASLEKQTSEASAAKQVFEQLNALNIDSWIGPRQLVVEKVDDETIPVCQLRNEGSVTGSSETLVENMSETFANFSDASLQFIGSGLKGTTHKNAYNKFLVRYLNTRCIGAGMQLLYNGFEQMPGLAQNIGFADISAVIAGSIPTGGRVSPTTQELLETGRTVSMPLVNVILGNNTASSHYPQEIAAKLVGSGHMQVGYCVASERFDRPDPNSSEYEQELATWKERSPDLFCEASPGHKGYVERVKDDTGRYSGLSKLLDELNSPTSPYIYEKLTTKAVASALPRLYGHLNFITAVPRWLPPAEKAKYDSTIEYVEGFEQEQSGRYFLTTGDSGTTMSMFGLFPIFMLSTVQDVPVSGGIAVVPSTSGQDVQSGTGSGCR